MPAGSYKANTAPRAEEEGGLESIELLGIGGPLIAFAVAGHCSPFNLLYSAIGTIA